MNRLTNKFSVMGRKYDLAFGQAFIWKKKIGEYKYDLIENAVDKLGQFEDIGEKHNVKSIDDLDKKLKALEIIKSKSIEVSLLKICEDVMAYNNEVKELYWLTREEFEIVKSIINPIDKGGIN